MTTTTGATPGATDAKATNAAARFTDSEHAWTATTATGVAVDEFEYVSQLSFLVTIGHLTKEQAGAMLGWYQSQGALPLPALPSPSGPGGLSLYEIVTTAERAVRDHHAAAGTDSIFGDIFSVVLAPIGGVIDGASTVLHAGSLLVDAASGFVHTLSEL